MNIMASNTDRERLDRLYGGRTAYHGELHNHAATGGTSDGKRDLSHWRGALEALHMDFAAILDHRQVRHMFLPEWEDGLFIGGTEPGTKIVDSPATRQYMHYNMVFASPEPLMELLSEFPEYEFTGGEEGHFQYPEFTTVRFGELIDAVKAHGGFFVHPHPKQNMKSEDPCSYWFRDETGIEVFYNGADHGFEEHTADNYKLWTDLLARGKRVWACAGGDEHACATNTALTTIYASAHANAAYLQQLRKGDFVCGPVGIRMCIGETTMGGRCDFTGNRLVVNVQDFHKSVRFPEHKYRLDILDDTGVIAQCEISCEEPVYIAIDTQDRAFYRVEVFDVTRDRRIAIGNPIWNRSGAESRKRR